MKSRILILAAILAVFVVGRPAAHAENFYTIASASASTAADDLWPASNLIQGPGAGFEATEPHDAFTGAGDQFLWVTAAPGGFPSDYIEETGTPIITLDLGLDVDLNEISTWGYSATNSNGVSEFSLRFATDADGTGGFGTSITFNPTYTMDLDPVPRQSNLFAETVTARYVEFTALDNYYANDGQGPPPGGDRVGFGEIAFVAGTVTRLEAVIDRDTGNITLRNLTPDQTPIISGYNLTSAVGGMDPSQWLSIAENYDADSGGSFDPVNNWLPFGATPDDIAEGTLGTAPFAPGVSIDLGNMWIKNPNEDIDVDVLLEDGTILNPIVLFEGNNDMSYELADLNFDNAINELDWPIYRDGYRQDLSGLSGAEGYQRGDLNFDGQNNVVDFGLFKTAYDGANGAGSFDRMLAGVPEPATWLLLLCGGAALAIRRCPLRGRLLALLALTTCLAVSVADGPSQAALPTLVSHYTLDSNGSDSAGTNNGTPTDVTFGLAGANANTGTSADFNGASSTIDVPYSADLNPDSFTVMLWANANTTGAPHQSAITSRDDTAGSTGTHGYIIYNAPSSNWEFWTGVGVPGWAGLNGGPVTTSVWTHLAISFDSASNTKSIFVNGTLANSTTTQNYSPNGTEESQNLHIGSGNDFGDQFFFEGMIDDVGIFNGVLTGDEVQNVAANGVAAFEPLRLTLRVDPDTGWGEMFNDVGIAPDIDQYEILSAGDSLNSAGWNSLQDQDYEGNGVPGTGNGWEELGTPNSSFLGEAFLQASSVIADSTTINLGRLYDTSVNLQDLAFTYRLTNGSVIEGIVEYGFVQPGFDEADFDQDGDVDGDDFLLWQGGFGTPSGAEKMDGDYDNDGDVDGDDFLGWQAEFGNSGGDGASAVPEPSTLGLLGLMLVGLALGWTRRKKGAQIMQHSSLLAIALSLSIAASALASSTNDRVYQLGDDPAESSSAGGNVSLTLDSAVPAAGAQQDLFALFSTPTYVDVGPSGLGRPGASSGELGVQFDGSSMEYLEGDRLGLPETSIASTVQGGPLDYTGIANRGFQLWIYPTVGANTEDQHIVMDTLQHGVGIAADGTWFMQYAGAARASSVAVTTDLWYHVMVVRPFGPSGGSRMYVDGVAVVATGGGYTGTDETVLTLGANTGDNFDTIPGLSNFFTGTVDDLEMFVMGTSIDTATDYGTFDLGTDNAFIAAQGLVDGDLTGDGQVLGDGSGGPNDDVAVFVDNWKAEKLLAGVRVGDLVSRNAGDFNYDGITDLLDWHVLRINHENPGNIPSLGSLLAGVPEPTTFALATLLAACACWRRRKDW